jgi:hypothetical protein
MHNSPRVRVLVVDDEPTITTLAHALAIENVVEVANAPLEGVAHPR